ncbi:lysylphosphatidylglycerol synthase transmembrane domain-containing protein [Thermodesulfobacteriota bacterium]
MRIIFRLLVSCLLFGYLAFWVNWTVLIEAFQTIDLNLYLISTLFALSTTISISAKFYVLIKNTTIARSFFSMVKINFISRFYGLFLPSSVGKATARWYLITENKKGRSFFLAATIFERTTFILTLLVFCSIALFVYSYHPFVIRMKSYLWPAILLLFAVTLFVMTYLLHPALHYRVKIFIGAMAKRYDKLEAVEKFVENFSLKNRSGTLLGTLLTISIIWYILFIFRMYFIFQSLAVPIPFHDIVWMCSLVLLIQMIPVSFAGIGVREGAYAFLLTTSNLPAERGVLIGILFFSQMLIFAVVGGFFELLKTE